MNQGLLSPDVAAEVDPLVCRDVLNQCGSFSLRKASRAVTQLYDDALQPVGLRSTQVVVLLTVAASNEPNMTRLAYELVTSPSTLSRSILPLQRDGYLEVKSDGGRGKIVTLTAKGHEKLLEVTPYWQKAQAKFLDLVGEASWQELSQRLAGMVKIVHG